jgi:hypothetical protein
LLSDKQVAAVPIGMPAPLRVSQVYACLAAGRSAVGRFAIKRIQGVVS